MCPFHMDGVGDVAEGNRVVLDLFAANRDPAIFGDNADQFDPDRTIPPGMLPSGLAFGIGLHTCVGRELDGGVVAKPGSSTEQFGIVALLVIRLLEYGARPDPDRSPEPDLTTTRPNWGRYPVVFASQS